MDTMNSTVKLLIGATTGPRAWFRCMDVNTNRPRTTRDRDRALTLSAAMGETIRFNLTARGFTVEVVHAEAGR